MTDSNPKQTSNCVLTSPAFSQLLGPDVMKLLRCGVCTDFFQVPIILPCGHTFCLHCLTQICTRAGLKQAPGSTNDVRIGCPSCHVLIYATPILRKNVTCNFIVQSLIECLKIKEITPNVQGINTERPASSNDASKNSIQRSTVMSSSSCKLAATSPEEQLATSYLLGQFDHLTRLLETSKPSIVDLAFMEVEEIRNEHLHREKQRQAQRDAKTRDQVRAVQNIMKKSREEQLKAMHHHDHQPPQQQHQPQNRHTFTRPPHQNLYSKTVPNHEVGHKPISESADLQQKQPFSRSMAFQNTVNPDNNTKTEFSSCNLPQTKDKQPVDKHSLKHPFQYNMQQQPRQSYHAWGQPRNTNETQPMQQLSRVSLQEPPQKCRKIAVTPIGARKAQMKENTNTILDQDHNPSGKSSTEGSSEKQKHCEQIGCDKNLSLTLKGGNKSTHNGNGSANAFLSKSDFSGDSVKLNDSAIMSFSMKSSQEVKSSCDSDKNKRQNT